MTTIKTFLIKRGSSSKKGELKYFECKSKKDFYIQLENYCKKKELKFDSLVFDSLKHGWFS
jgi:hypothetical protein